MCQSEVGAEGIQSDWDHFVFSQQWPASVCVESSEKHQHKCEIPPKVSTWTVHGIWPSEGASEGPFFCNKSAKFDPDKIKTIVDELEQYWPNLYADSPLDAFWEHEWDKHGTCAMTLDAVDSELKYFTKGIDLRRQFDLLSILQTSSIVPSDDNSYPYEDVVSALSNVLGGTPTISCFRDPATSIQYITEVEFCMNTAFSTIQCPLRNTPDVAPPRYRHRVLSSNADVISMVQQGISVDVTPSNSQCNHHEPIAYPALRHQ
jgi:ribonuclease T2